MKTKTSITLDAAIVAELDKLAGKDRSRSAVIERIVRRYIRSRNRAARAARDLAIINRHSARLNEEAADVAAYQAWPSE